DRIISNLEERKFIRNCGKQETGRRANLYEVTSKFLSYLGIKNVGELPDYNLLKEKIKNMENITINED
ncbi:SMC-Scp complex subunit ScpB, partial [Fusobacterium nucleatum]